MFLFPLYPEQNLLFYIFLAALQEKRRFLNVEEWRYFVLLIILIHIIYCTKRSTHFLYLRFGQEFQFGCLYLGLCLKYSCNATILHILVQQLQYCLRIEQKICSRIFILAHDLCAYFNTAKITQLIYTVIGILYNGPKIFYLQLMALKVQGGEGLNPPTHPPSLCT